MRAQRTTLDPRADAKRAFVALVGATVAALACGGKAVESPSADGGAQEGGAATCAPLAGCASSSRCPAPDGCNVCTCADGAWACTALGCAPPPCPDFGPSAGAACAAEGQSCQVPGRCGAQCTCTAHAWSCIVPPCPAPTCPPSPPPNASACDIELDVCDYGSGCSAVHCYCGRTPEDSGWNCGPAPCDAGADRTGAG